MNLKKLQSISDATHEERFENAYKKYGTNPKGYISELSRCKGDKLIDRANKWVELANEKGLTDVSKAITYNFLTREGIRSHLLPHESGSKGTADFTPICGGYMYASDTFFYNFTKQGFNVSRKSGKSSDYDTSLMSRNGNAWLIPYVYTLEKNGESHSYDVANMTKESGGSYGWMIPGWSERMTWARCKEDLLRDINRDFKLS